MKLARFEQILGAYGADPASWPAREASSATALLAGSKDARRALHDARRIEAALARTTGFGTVPGDAVARITGAAFARIDRLEQARARPADRRQARAWLKPASLAFGAMLLFTLGIDLGAAQWRDTQDAAATLMIDGPYESLASL